jgi:TP901-1 family phage major tail protein
MPASTNVMNGTDVLLAISTDGGTTYTTVGKATTASLQMNMEVRDVTTKDSAGWRELLGGLKSWSLSGEGMVTYNLTSKVGFSDLFGHINSRTRLYFRFGSTTTDEKQYKGYGFLTSLSQDGGVEDNNSFSFSIEGDGTLVQATAA